MWSSSPIGTRRRTCSRSIYEALGNTQGAADLERGVGDQVQAKVLLGLVALVVGVGGIWMLYIGVSAIVGLLESQVAGPDPALGVRHPGHRPARRLSRLSDDRDDHHQLHRADQRRSAGALQAAAVSRSSSASSATTSSGSSSAPAGSVLLGLLIAGLLDRVRREALAKTFIFLPLAISFIGASVIWRFMYEWNPPGQTQIGLVNAVWTGLGFAPVRWVQDPPINTYALILIFVWLQTGFAMVVLSAAIKGVSVEVIEAARLDGASERQTLLQGDRADHQGLDHHGGDHHRDRRPEDLRHHLRHDRRADTAPTSIANRMFLEMSTSSSTMAAPRRWPSVLFLAVLPIMFINVRNLRRQGIGS